MPIEAIRERERLNSVNSYYLGSRDPALDGLARLAGAIFGVPYASVSIVEKDRAILVGALGLEFESVDRCDSICSGVIRSQMISVVADTHKDERLSKNRFVVGAPNLRFAAAAPIINDKGFVLGGFCLGDRVPRIFSERDQLVLKSLAQQAVALMELRRLNANANEYRRQLSTVEKMHAVGELAAAVAHEINNPLLVLRANAERLLEDATAMKEARPTVEKAANSMLRMSDRIGKITQTLREHLYDGAKEDLDFCSLGEIVNSALEVCGDRFVTEKIRLISDFDDTFFFTCRSTVVSQILVNLLTNAMDAVSQLDQKWIDLTVKVENGYVIFRITDSGAITDDQIRSKLMTPFFTTKIRGKGLGLGLNLSRRLAESSGGALMLDKASENTSFVLHLPLRCTLS